MYAVQLEDGTAMSTKYKCCYKHAEENIIYGVFISCDFGISETIIVNTSIC